MQGEFPDIKEANYLGPRGYTVDASAPPALLDSLIYKLSYYGYALVYVLLCPAILCCWLLLLRPLRDMRDMLVDGSSSTALHCTGIGGHLAAVR